MGNLVCSFSYCFSYKIDTSWKMNLLWKHQKSFHLNIFFCVCRGPICAIWPQTDYIWDTAELFSFPTTFTHFHVFTQSFYLKVHILPWWQRLAGFQQDQKNMFIVFVFICKFKTKRRFLDPLPLTLKDYLNHKDLWSAVLHMHLLLWPSYLTWQAHNICIYRIFLQAKTSLPKKEGKFQ